MKFLIFGLLFAAASIQFSESLSISTSYYESDPKDELLKQAENLKKLATDEIEKLKSQGKTLLAGGLESAEKFILDLETRLKNLNPTSALGKALLGSLEALLKKGEETLEAEIKKLSGSFYADDIKAELLKQAENLKKLAADEIEKLKSQGKTLLAGGLENAEKFILDLETQLKNLNPTSALGKALLGSLEALLKKGEEALEAEIKKLSGSFYADDIKAELLKQAENLKKLAADEIEKLKSQGKTLLAGGLESAEKFILDLETQLKNLNPTSALGKALLGSLEALLKKGEEALEAEIKKLSGSFYADDIKAELLKQAENLKKLATDEIEKLKSQGKTLLAGGLESAVKFILDLETQLKNLNPTSALGKALLGSLEALLKKGEETLEAEIKKLSGSFYADDIKAELLKQAENLKKLAADEIEKLKSQGKTLLAGGLENAEKFILDLETQLKNLNPTSALGKALLGSLEALLKKGEEALEAEIKKLSGSFYADDIKAELLKQAENLKKLATDEIEKLKSQGKTLLAGGLESAEKFILDLENQLKNLNPTSALGKALLSSLEALLKKGEEALEAEIKKLSGSF